MPVGIRSLKSIGAFVNMDEKKIELITKLVMEVMQDEPAAGSKEGYMVPIGVSACASDTGACRGIVWTRISADQEKRPDGWSVCFQ